MFSKRVMLAVASACLIIGLFGFEFNMFSKQQKTESKQNLIHSLNDAAIHCYAVEGRFPPSLDYLCETYGIYYDHEAYTVFYEIFASNMMPDITVIDGEAQ